MNNIARRPTPVGTTINLSSLQNRELESAQTNSKERPSAPKDTVLLSSKERQEIETSKLKPPTDRVDKGDKEDNEISGLAKLAVVAAMGATAVATYAAAKTLGFSELSPLSGGVSASAIANSGLAQIGGLVGGVIGGVSAVSRATTATVIAGVSAPYPAGVGLGLAVGASIIGIGAAAGAGLGIGVGLFPITAVAGAASLASGILVREASVSFSEKNLLHSAKRKLTWNKKPGSRELRTLSKQLPINAKYQWSKAGEPQGLEVECADLFRDGWLSANGIHKNHDGQYVSKRSPNLEIDVQPTLRPKYSHLKWSKMTFRIPKDD